MRPLAALERFFERIFERPSARLFRTRLQPVQIQRRIERAMETERLSGADRTLVPNRFRVHLHPDDLSEFGDMAGTLAAELADGALTFARAHRYALADRPRVDLVADRTTVRGDIRVHAKFADPEPPTRAPAPERDRDRRADEPDSVGAGTGAGAGAAGAAGATAGAGASTGPVDPEADAGRTRVFKVPIVEAPLARLREVRPDGTQREVEVDGSALTIGRGSDNGLVLHDSRVSRHHARLQARRGALLFTDLGSTNGSRVNGTRVAEVVLGEGDRIELGDTVLVIESLSAG